MLKEVLENRFTAKWWDETPVEEEKLKEILDCAYLAPSKQGRHDHEIVVLTDSEEGRRLKEDFFWNETWCFEKERNKEGQGLKRFNRQMIAPVVLIWAGKWFQTETKFGENEYTRVRDDAIVSASFAVCAAASLGLQSGFCSTLNCGPMAGKLGYGKERWAIVALGIGYAQKESAYIKPIVDQYGNAVGFDLGNVDPTDRRAENRKHRPPIENMIKYI